MSQFFPALSDFQKHKKYSGGRPQQPRRPSLPLIIGRKPVVEALQSGQVVEKIFLLRTAHGEEVQEIRQRAQSQNIPLSLVPEEKLNQLTKAQHQGVVAFGGLLSYTDLQSAIDFVVDKGETPLFLLLDGVTDVRNAGAIARTALCCGAQGIILPTSNSATLNEEAIKTSAGALTQLLLCRVPSTQQAMDVLQLNGIRILGTQMKSNTAVYEEDFTGPVCVIMGGEERGISKEVVKRADALIHIPMATGFDSLNVSVAAGMVLYEALKQRKDQHV